MKKIIWACEGGAYSISEKNFIRFMQSQKDEAGKPIEDFKGKYIGRCYEGYPSEQDYFGYEVK